MRKSNINDRSDRMQNIPLRTDLGAKLRAALREQSRVLPTADYSELEFCGGLCEPMCRQCHRRADEAAEYRNNEEPWDRDRGGHTLYCPRGCCDGNDK